MLSDHASQSRPDGPALSAMLSAYFVDGTARTVSVPTFQSPMWSQGAAPTQYAANTPPPARATNATLPVSAEEVPALDPGALSVGPTAGRICFTKVPFAAAPSPLAYH